MSAVDVIHHSSIDIPNPGGRRKWVLYASCTQPLRVHSSAYRKDRLDRDDRRVSYYNSRVEIHSAARKHGIAHADIEHAVEHAMTIENQDDDTRLYLGPARSAALLEVVTVVRHDESEIAIHAMGMRAKYQRLLPGG
jgi:hypothetical protein